MNTSFSLLTVLPTGFTPLDMMSVEDLGPVVLQVLSNRDKFLDKTLSVSGDKLTIREVAFVLNRYLAPKSFRDKQVSVLNRYLAPNKQVSVLNRYLSSNKQVSVLKRYLAPKSFKQVSVLNRYQRLHLSLSRKRKTN